MTVAEVHSRKRILLVTGLSGAGKTTVLKTLEDLGWEAVDNFPIRLAGSLLALPSPEGRHDSADGEHADQPGRKPAPLGRFDNDDIGNLMRGSSIDRHLAAGGVPVAIWPFFIGIGRATSGV